MENVPAISVIIPMYNVEKYIGECLESILLQTFQDFEVIVVDDCSKDNSCAVAESYVGKFGGRLQIYANERNSGAAATRNNGLRRAVGEYVYFMDSDDLLLLTGLEKMYTTAKEYNADVVNLLGYYKMSLDGKELTNISHRISRVIEASRDVRVDDDLIWRLEKPLDYRFYSVPWIRFFRRAFLIENQLFFPENVKRCEDVVWKHGIFLLAKRIVHISDILYFYRMSEISLSRQRRTRTQYIKSRMTTIIDGIKWIDNLMERVDFFNQNPQYRYKILEDFLSDMFRRFRGYTTKKRLKPAVVYADIKQEFGAKLGKQDVLVSELCSLIDEQMQEIARLEEQLKA